MLLISSYQKHQLPKSLLKKVAIGVFFALNFSGVTKLINSYGF